MKHRFLILVAAVALLSAAVAVVFLPSRGMGQESGGKGNARESADANALEKKPAPDFKLESLDGKEVSLADFKGNVVVLDFWATWCGPCRASMPHLQALSADKELAGKGLKVVAVDAEEEKGDVQGFIQKAGYTFAVLLDKDGKMVKDYGVSGFPTTVVVGRDGTVKNVFLGLTPDSPKKLDEAVAAALKEEAPKK